MTGGATQLFARFAGLSCCETSANELTWPLAAMSELERETTEGSGADGAARVRPGPPEADSGGVGERVSAILHAAEEAAEQIRSEARLETDALVREAQREAEAKISELTQTAAETRREADDYARDMRMAVEAYAKKHRQEAEEQARKLTAEAEARAQSILAAAQADAQRLEEAARRHQEALRSETHRLEERRRQALHGVRELMAILEELLEEAHEPAPDETLTGTLEERRRLLGHRSS
ncbi:MAG TPA: hypothetical protein VF002_08725 [Gaiellaceae bacterium]